jgi:hypothetical protein
MATKKAPALTAEHDRDTAKGKRRYRVGESGDSVVGTLYLDKDHALFDEDVIEIELKSVS